MSTGLTSIAALSENTLLPTDDPIADHPYISYLRAAMVRADLNPEQLAIRSGISKTTISFILNGKQAPETITNPVHRALAKAVGVPMYRLVEKAGYNLFEGEDLGNVATINQVADLPIPPIHSIADLVSLPEETIEALVRILTRGRNQTRR